MISGGIAPLVVGIGLQCKPVSFGLDNYLNILNFIRKHSFGVIVGNIFRKLIRLQSFFQEWGHYLIRLQSSVKNEEKS